MRFGKASLLTVAWSLSLLGCSGIPREPRSTASPTSIEVGHEPPAAVAEQPKADKAKLKPLAVALDRFGMKIYEHVATRREGNLAVSPVGSFLLLEMLYEGASTPAQQSMAAILGRPQLGFAEAALLAWELNHLPSTHVAQRVYVDESVQVQESYATRVTPLLGDSVKAVPLASRPEEAAREISGWIDEQTGGLLKGAMSPPPPRTLAVLVSTLYFRGRWTHEFSEGDTQPEKFFLKDGTTVKVPTMKLWEEWLDTFDVPHGQGVILPYRDDTEMLLVLPDEGFTPDQILQNMDPTIRLGKYATGDPLVTLDLPRFEFKVEDLDLTDAWKTAGLEAALKGTDLTSMLTFSESVPMDITVRHQTFIKVDEKGTVAAAATEAMPSAAATPEPHPVKTLRFNRPFAFLLRHSRTGTILMMGRVEEP